MFESDQLQDLRSEPGKHEPTHRQCDEGFTALRQALMIAGESAQAGDPGNGSLDDPSLGQDLKA